VPAGVSRTRRGVQRQRHATGKARLSRRRSRRMRGRSNGQSSIWPDQARPNLSRGSLTASARNRSISHYADRYYQSGHAQIEKPGAPLRRSCQADHQHGNHEGQSTQKEGHVFQAKAQSFLHAIEHHKFLGLTPVTRTEAVIGTICDTAAGGSPCRNHQNANGERSQALPAMSDRQRNQLKS